MKKKTVSKKVKTRTGDEVVDALYDAVINYVEKHKGTAIIIGGIALVEESEGFNYGVMVRVTGKKPVFLPK